MFTARVSNDEIVYRPKELKQVRHYILGNRIGKGRKVVCNKKK